MTITTASLKQAMTARKLVPLDDVSIDGFVESVNSVQACLEASGMTAFAIAAAQTTAAILMCVNNMAATISGERAGAGGSNAGRDYDRTDTAALRRAMLTQLRQADKSGCLTSLPGVTAGGWALFLLAGQGRC